MEGEEQTEEKKGSKWGYLIGGAIVVAVIILFFVLFHNGDVDEGMEEVDDIEEIQDAEPVEDTTPVEIEVVEPTGETGLANPSAVYCEEQGGEYKTEAETPIPC